MYKKTELHNGVPLVMHRSREFHSVCVGIWIKSGSRNETKGKSGISHFLEHMMFKGTEKRSARDIAVEIDSMGGELNALTSSEYTLYYVKVLGEYILPALAILTDIVMHSVFAADEVEKEKNIVYEEIKMVEDNPSDYVHDLFSRHVWGQSGIGQPVLGTVESINAFTRNDLIEHTKRFYGAENIVVSCSGNFDETAVVDFLNGSIGGIQQAVYSRSTDTPRFISGNNFIEKDLSEAHMCIGLQGLPYSSDDRYRMHLLNTMLGTGISSRLFQNVREQRGLVYSIYSYHLTYYDAGVWAVYAGTDRKHVSDVVNITVDEICSLAKTVSDDELCRARAQLKGNLVLALESTSNRMTNIAKQEIYYGKYYSPEEIISMVETVTLDEVRELAGNIAGERAFALTVYGPLNEDDIKGSCTLVQ